MSTPPAPSSPSTRPENTRVDEDRVPPRTFMSRVRFHSMLVLGFSLASSVVASNGHSFGAPVGNWSALTSDRYIYEYYVREAVFAPFSTFLALCIAQAAALNALMARRSPTGIVTWTAPFAIAALLFWQAARLGDGNYGWMSLVVAISGLVVLRMFAGLDVGLSDFVGLMLLACVVVAGGVVGDAVTMSLADDLRDALQGAPPQTERIVTAIAYVPLRFLRFVPPAMAGCLSIAPYLDRWAGVRDVFESMKRSKWTAVCVGYVLGELAGFVFEYAHFWPVSYGRWAVVLFVPSGIAAALYSLARTDANRPAQL